MPGGATPVAGAPGSANARRRRAPGRRATAAVRYRIVCPQAYARRPMPAGLCPQGYCGIVQMGPQADAPCLGRGHLLPMNALTEMCGSRNGKRAPGGRPSMVPASRPGGHLKETRCATASIQRG